MNVVFVVLDTLRKDRVSVYNDDIDFTGSLEEFAEDSIVFSDAVSQAPWTLPSHASMFTGMYPWEHEATQKNLYLDKEKEMLAEKFKDNSYSTGCFTSNTWISPYTGMTEGFDEEKNFFGVLPDRIGSDKIKTLWSKLSDSRFQPIIDKLMAVGEYFHRGETESSTPEVIEDSREFVESHGDEDFFLFVNFMDAHIPHHPPENYLERHSVEKDPDDICQKVYLHNSGQKEVDFEAASSIYDADVDYLDDQLDNFFEIFREKSLEEDTIFVVVSDHGENLGENNMYGHQFSVSEKLVSVPLMIKSPVHESREVNDQFELKELYNLIPEMAFNQEFSPTTSNFSKGGYEYPELDLRKIPEKKYDELGKKLRFVRNGDESKKIVQKGESFRMIDLKKMEDIEIEEDYKKKIKTIGEGDEGERISEKDEKIKDSLEELGYI
jgi:choline-sulfatase